MSIKSIKQLTLRAKNSITMLNPFNGDENTRIQQSTTSCDKDDEPLHVEEFGILLGNGSSSNDTRRYCSNRESPSKRVKLLGSLRTVGSFRTLRSSTPKEKKSNPNGTYSEPDIPKTPVRETRPSVSLNLEESPQEKFVFDFMPRKPSLSSSMVVHHSSPLPIPNSATQETVPVSDSALPELPNGTIPKTPTPLQVALESDPDRLSSPCRNSSPAFDNASGPMPSPLPGTNFDLDANDDLDAYLGHKGEVYSNVEPPSYFEIPHNYAAQGMKSYERVEACGTMTNRSQREILGRQMTRGPIENSDQPIVHTCQSEKNYTHNTGTSSNAPCGACQRLRSAQVCKSGGHGHVLRQDSSDHGLLLDNIRHLDSVVYPDGYNMFCHPIYDPATNPAQVHENFYAGTGCGERDDSNSPAPTAPSSLLKQNSERKSTSTWSTYLDDMCNEAYAANDLGTHCRDNDEETDDHETLEDVIRIYATYDDDEGYDVVDILPDGVEEGMIAESSADVELANRVADCSLGA